MGTFIFYNDHCKVSFKTVHKYTQKYNSYNGILGHGILADTA